MQDNLHEILRRIKSLSPQDYQSLIDLLLAEPQPEAKSISKFASDIKSSDVYICPYCGSQHIQRNGHRPDGVQKYICKDCNRSFVPTTNTVFAYTHKSLEEWFAYLRCVLSKKTIREAAENCGLNIKTSFQWRHKVLKSLVLMEDGVTLEGISEGDETYFALSFKGNRRAFQNGEVDRAPHKRGHEVHKRGLSKEQVCVPCIVDRERHSVAKTACLGTCSSKALESVLGNCLQQLTTLCTDENAVYRRFAKEHNLNLVQIKGGKTYRGLYHIQHLNSYHSMLKKFLRKFNGVATKYLNGYLAWHNFLDYAKESIAEKSNILKEWLVKSSSHSTWTDIMGMAPMPTMA